MVSGGEFPFMLQQLLQHKREFTAFACALELTARGDCAVMAARCLCRLWQTGKPSNRELFGQVILSSPNPLAFTIHAD